MRTGRTTDRRRMMIRLSAIMMALLLVAGVFALFEKETMAADVNASSQYTFMVLENEEVPLAPSPDNLPDYTASVILFVNLLIAGVFIGIYAYSYHSYRERVKALAPSLGKEAWRLKDSSLLWHPIKRQRYIKEYEAKLASRYI